MANNQGKINLGVGFNVDTASLEKVKKSLQSLRKMTGEQIKAAGGEILPLSNMKTKSWTNDLGEMRKDIDALGKALEDAFNPKLGTYELNKFNESLKQSGTSTERVFQTVSAYGEKGQVELLNMTTNMLAVDRAAKEVNSTFKKLGDTMMNTLRWTITSTAINTITGAIQQAYHYSLDLDRSLNDIRIVTGKSADDMEKFARQANKAAKSLGASTTDYTSASLIYYQQGLSDAEVKARTETTIKAANITGQSADAVSEQLTAVWNGYKVSAEESELYIDKLAAVAASTAADLEELSTGMSKVASAANIMGVDFDQLNAQISTIVSVTREAPESIGTALKTVYARMSDIEAGLDTETTLGEYTSQMAQMGINVLDAQGNLRDMGDVVEEIGNKWNSLNREQQTSLAQSIAGTRQYSRMMALFDNWDMYQESLVTSTEAAGTLATQNAIYLDSIEGHQNKLKASAEELYDSIFNSNEIKGVYDALSGIVEMIDHLVQSLGGMPGLLALAATIFTKIAKNNIADLMVKSQTNKLNQAMNKQQIQSGMEMLKMLSTQTLKNEELNEHLQRTIELEQEIYNKADNLTGDQWNNLQAGVRQYNEMVQQTVKLEDELAQKKKEQKAYWKAPGRVTRNAVGATKPLIRTEGAYYLTQEEDGVDSSGKSVMGLQSLEKKAISLRQKQKNASGRKAKKYSDEAKELENLIKLAREENKVREDAIKTNKAYEDAIKKNKQATEDYGRALETTVDKDKFANRAADIINGLTSIAFTATATSSSIVDLTEKVKEGEDSFEDWLSSLGGIAMSLGTTVVSSLNSMRTALNGGKVATLAGAAAWQYYWAAATMGISLVITALTTVASLIKSNQEAQREAAKETINDAKEEIEKYKTLIDLTNNYLTLYEAYKTTAEGAEQLREAGEALLKQQYDEELELALIAKNYDAIYQRMIAIREEKRKQEVSEAEKIKENAESIVDNNSFMPKGVKNPSAMGAGTLPNWSIVGGKKDEDESNFEILKSYIGDYIEEGSSSQSIVLKANLTAAEKIDLYNKIEEATKSTNPKWESSGKLHKNIQKLLNDADYKSAAEDWSEANKTIDKYEVATEIKNQGLGDTTDLASFAEKRKTLIANLEADGYSNEVATSMVDTQLKGYNANTEKLLSREKTLLSLEKYNNLSVGNDLRARNSELSNAAFSALSTLDLSQYSDAGKLIEAAKAKAVELQDATWTAFGEERLKSLEKAYNDLGKTIDKSIGSGKATAIQEQNKNLQDQQKILQAIIDDQEKAFTNKKTEFETKTGITYTNPEETKRRINELYSKNLINEDLRGEYLALLQGVTTAENSYNDALTDIADNQEQIYQNNIKSFEAEIEYLDDVSSKYANLVDTMQSIVALHKSISGEDAFTGVVGLYSSMVGYAQSSSANAKNSWEKLLAEFSSSDTVYATAADKQAAWDKTVGAATAYIAALQHEIDLYKETLANSINAIWEESAKTIAGVSLNYLNAEWDRELEQSKKYLDTIEETYELKKFETSIQEKINKMTNKNAQARITAELQTQLKTLREIDKLSKTDIERAERKLKILEAEIALEEARNNKNQLRLVRGTNGTYSYQYVVDQNAILEAEKQVEEAKYEDYQKDKEAYQTSISDFQSLYRSFAEEYANAPDELKPYILKKYKEDMQKALETQQKLSADMQEKYGEQWEFGDTSMETWMSGIAAEGGVDSLITAIENAPDYKKEIADIQSKVGDIVTGLKSLGADIPGYDTGGYTGSWGSSGKLAVLHEKELVLNQEDTSNILNAVELTRALNANMSHSIWALLAQIKAPQTNVASSETQTIEQKVEIKAEFPNATDRHEIEEAFNNLVGLASQHAYKTTR